MNGCPCAPSATEASSASAVRDASIVVVGVRDLNSHSSTRHRSRESTSERAVRARDIGDGETDE